MEKLLNWNLLIQMYQESRLFPLGMGIESIRISSDGPPLAVVVQNSKIPAGKIQKKGRGRLDLVELQFDSQLYYFALLKKKPTMPKPITDRILNKTKVSKLSH